MKTVRMIASLALACSAAAQIQPAAAPHAGSGQVSSSVMALFDTYELVALGEWHNSLQDYRLRIDLMHHPDFPKKVRDVVVECGNSLYQNLLDRYVGGDPVPAEEIRKVWRDTTQSPVMDEDSVGTCKALIEDVRSLNRTLPAGMKIRMLAGDSPIDWSKVKTTEDFVPFLRSRDESAARVIEREVVTRGRRALIIYGAGHIWRNNAFNRSSNIAALIDKDYPGKLFTVIRLTGPYPDTAKLESLIAEPNRPVLIKLKGSPVGQLDANEFIGRDVPVKFFPEGLGMAQVADACIYTGTMPDSAMRAAENQEQDAAWNAEKARRRALMPHPRR